MICQNLHRTVTVGNISDIILIYGQGGPWYMWPSRLGSCKGNIIMDTNVSRTRPELFVPQGVASLKWFAPISAGTWPCHEKTGGGCGDTTRQPWPGPGGIAPLTPAEKARTCESGNPPYRCLPSNPLVLVNASGGTASWSKLGRFRSVSNRSHIVIVILNANRRLTETKERQTQDHT